MRAWRIVVVSVACATGCALVGSLPAFGQGQKQDDLQPGVNTSALPPQSNTGTITRAAPTPARAAAASSAPVAKAAHTGKAMDRLDLAAEQVTGNKELPKVMYVVPWKHSDLGDLTGKPANSLVDEVLQPVDRDVFNREERYYHTVAPEKSSAGPQPGTAAQH
jgi:hypothetical protein